MLEGYSVKPLDFLRLDDLLGAAGDPLNGEEDPVSFWAPRREDILRITDLAKAMDPSPTIWDVGGGNCFLGYLMAMENANVRVLDNNRFYLNNRYSHPGMLFYLTGARSLRSMAADMDMVVCGGMSRAKDFTDDILLCQPKMVVYVMDKGGVSGIQPTANGYDQISEDVSKRVSYNPGSRYDIVFSWESQADDEILWAIRGFPIENYSYKNNIRIEVQIRKDIKTPMHLEYGTAEKYHWEKELEEYFGQIQPMVHYDRG
jgi:hypothetical protein